MIQDRWHSCSHYFDCKGITHDIKTDSLLNFNPLTINLSLKDGRVMSLFLANNPWRATSKDRQPQMAYQYCVFCKEKRFENGSFNGSEVDFKKIENTLRPGSGESLFFCQKSSCWITWRNLSQNISEDKFDSVFSLSKIDKFPETILKEQKIN